MSFEPIIHPWNTEHWQDLTGQAGHNNHALLFSGQTGLGKFDLAMAFAHHVLTQSQSQPQSADLFNAASHPDFHVLMTEQKAIDLGEEQLVSLFAQRYFEQHSGKPKKNISIDQVRKLGSAISTHPHISEYRVVLVVDAEKMNFNAANAILKNLEEPPANTLFVLVSDEVSSLPKTVRSRCSMVQFRTPSYEAGRQWLSQQQRMPEHDIDTHLAMANNQPLLALRMFEQEFIAHLKSIFTDLNGLWSHKREATAVAKNWQDLGSAVTIDVLQKLFADVMRYRAAAEPPAVFFPVQQSWVASISSKFDHSRLLALQDYMNQAKQLLATTVDELLVMETLSVKCAQLPN